MPISDDCTMLDMLKHVVQNFADGTIEKMVSINLVFYTYMISIKIVRIANIPFPLYKLTSVLHLQRKYISSLKIAICS